MKPGQLLARFQTKDGRQVVLRVPTMNDLGAMLRFANKLVKERETNPVLGIVSLDRKMTRAGERQFLERVLAGIRRREGVSVAAFVGDELVGTCEVTRRRPYDVKHSGVLGIVVQDGYRGVGLGGLMVKTVLKEAQRIGVWLVELQVFANNPVAIRLYEQNGFRRVGVVPNKIQRRGRLIDEVRMYADLRGTDKSKKGGRQIG